MSLGFPILQPTPQRRLRFTRASPGKQTFDTDVFIQIGPMNSFTVAYEAPMRSLSSIAV